MAGSKGIRAGKAFVELYADDSRMVRGLRRAQRKLKAFSASITSIGLRVGGMGAAISAPVLAATKSFSDFGDAVNKMSARTGLSAKAVSGLGFAAEQSGSDVETLEAGFRGMARTILNANRGLSEASDSLTDVGLSVADLQGLSPEDQFKLIAERISQVSDPTQKAALAMKIFGRSGQQLIPLLNEGAAGISDLQAEAEKLGITMSDEDAAAAAKLTDAMNRVKRAMKAAWISGGMALAEGMTKFFNIVSDVIPKINDFVKRNRKMITMVAAAAGTLFLAGTALVGIGAVASVAAIGIGALATAAGILLSPLGLLATGAALLVGWFIKSGKAVEVLNALFPTLSKTFGEAFDAIKRALSAGDISSAARVMWAAINLEWTRGINRLQAKWTRFTNLAMQAARLIDEEEAADRLSDSQREARERLKDAIDEFDNAKEAATSAAEEAKRERSEIAAALRDGPGQSQTAKQLASQGGTMQAFSERAFVSFGRQAMDTEGMKITEGERQLIQKMDEVKKTLDGVVL